jgi:hypothetical protein
MTITVRRRFTIIAAGVALFFLSGAQPARAEPACAAGTGTAPTVPTWSPSATTPHGVHLFLSTTEIRLPSGPSSAQVELWGGGGGGGGGADDSFSEGGPGGGGGASGAYLRGTINVAPGRAYRLVVGTGGRGGDTGRDGQDGSASAVCDGENALLQAPGGHGGLGAQSGHEGAGGRATDADVDAANALERPGRSGGAGTQPLFRFNGSGGRGGSSVSGTIRPQGSSGGNGGAGGMRPQPAGRGADGGAGSIIVTW